MKKSNKYLRIKQVCPGWKTLSETDKSTNYIVELKWYKIRVNIVNYAKLWFKLLRKLITHRCKTYYRRTLMWQEQSILEINKWEYVWNESRCIENINGWCERIRDVLLVRELVGELTLLYQRRINCMSYIYGFQPDAFSWK